MAQRLAQVVCPFGRVLLGFELQEAGIEIILLKMKCSVSVSLEKIQVWTVQEGINLCV